MQERLLRRRASLILLLLTPVVPPGLAAADTVAGTPIWFTETGHTLALWYLLTLSAWSITSFVIIQPMYRQAVGYSACMTLFIEVSRC